MMCQSVAAISSASRGRAMTAIAVLIVVGLIGLAGLLIVRSPGRPAPLVDAAGQQIAGAMSERVFVEINGIPPRNDNSKRRSFEPRAAVPARRSGNADVFSQHYPSTGLEHDFTVVWWEQRGAGMSFIAASRQETMTISSSSLTRSQ